MRNDGVGLIACRPPLSSVTHLCLEEAWGRMDAGEFLNALQSAVVLVSLVLGGAIVHEARLYILALRNQKVEIASLRDLMFTSDAWPKYYPKRARSEGLQL